MHDGITVEEGVNFSTFQRMFGTDNKKGKSTERNQVPLVVKQQKKFQKVNFSEEFVVKVPL